jgi:hypothetical protein
MCGTGSKRTQDFGRKRNVARFEDTYVAARQKRTASKDTESRMLLAILTPAVLGLLLLRGSAPGWPRRFLLVIAGGVLLGTILWGARLLSTTVLHILPRQMTWNKVLWRMHNDSRSRRLWS